MKIEDFADKKPAFVLEQFFAGRTQGWGLPLSRFETFQNQFKIGAKGHWDDISQTLSLREFTPSTTATSTRSTGPFEKLTPVFTSVMRRASPGRQKARRTGNTIRMSRPPTIRRHLASTTGLAAGFGYDGSARDPPQTWRRSVDAKRFLSKASLTIFSAGRHGRIYER